MQTASDITTVLCLFHTQRQAQEALAELQGSVVPASSIVVLDGESSSGGANRALSALRDLALPEKDLRLLTEGVNAGGTVIMVSGPEPITDEAEDVFGRHRAKQVDEKVLGQETTASASAPVTGATAAATAGAAKGEAVIPVVEEELTVGKRAVQRGGVRVYSRIVETPVEEKVVLREEHATVERHPVDRPLSEADLDALRIQSVEVTETAEVPVVAKTARVVEEVHVSKDVSERTEEISDSVRKTEIDVEPIGVEPSGTLATGKQKAARKGN